MRRGLPHFYFAVESFGGDFERAEGKAKRRPFRERRLLARPTRPGAVDCPRRLGFLLWGTAPGESFELGTVRLGSIEAESAASASVSASERAESCVGGTGLPARADGAAPSVRPVHGVCRNKRSYGQRNSAMRSILRPASKTPFASSLRLRPLRAVRRRKGSFGGRRKMAQDQTRGASGANPGRLSTCPLSSAIKRSALVSVPVLPRGPSSKP